MICGSRVRFRALERSDLAECQKWLNDPEVIEGLLQIVPLSSDDEENWYQQAMSREREARPLALEVLDGNGWRYVGNIGLMNLEWQARAAELGIFIGDKSIWNKGFGSEAVELLLRHGFETLNLNRIYLHVFANNLRARRSYEKVGFVLEGTLREAAYRHGGYLDVHLMSVLRSEWTAQREG